MTAHIFSSRLSKSADVIYAWRPPRSRPRRSGPPRGREGRSRTAIDDIVSGLSSISLYHIPHTSAMAVPFWRIMLLKAVHGPSSSRASVKAHRVFLILATFLERVPQLLAIGVFASHPHYDVSDMRMARRSKSICSLQAPAPRGRIQSVCTRPPANDRSNLIVGRGFRPSYEE